MKPTQQQQNIISAAKERKNLSIQARAGAAKTTTCVMVAEEVVKPSLYISFNKDIAEEAKEKFPSHVVCQTIHSIAYKAIIKFPKSAFGKRLNAVLLLSDITPLLEGIAFHNEEDAFDFRNSHGPNKPERNNIG
jgi:superfamily I DNA/RNA helicase